MWDRCYKGTDLHGQGDRNGRFYFSNQIHLPIFYISRGNFRIGCKIIHIQLKSICASFLDLARVICPATFRDAVQTADDGDLQSFFQTS